MIDQLNQRYAVPGFISFSSGQGGLARATLSNSGATAEIFLHGAHLTSYTHPTAGELLWMSDKSAFASNRPIRGGVPICWPWFGQPSPELPQHGFARTSNWEVHETKSTGESSAEICLRLTASEATRSLWPHQFKLLMRVIVGERLTMQLECTNQGDAPLRAEAALHTYFGLDDISHTTIHGLSGCKYIDKLDDMQVKTLSDKFVVDREVDRIFIDTDDEVTVEQSACPAIRITKTGSASTVVWNPWIKKAKAMEDFPDDGYNRMLCVETTNAAGDARTIDPGQSHSITQSISVTN